MAGDGRPELPFSSVSPAGTADHDGGTPHDVVWNPKFDTLLEAVAYRLGDDTGGRFAAEVGSSSIRWRAVIPGGQSGFAGDPNYMDQIPAYLANQPGDQPYARSEVEAAASRSVRFTP